MSLSASPSASPISSKSAKRSASDDLSSEQRMTKRLQLLNLSPTSNDSLWIPANTPTAPSNTRRTAVATAPTATAQPSRSAPGLSSQERVDAADVEYMQVEETPHRIYIHNLDAELHSSPSSSDDDDESNRVVFIPDVERQLSRVPQHVLTGKSAGGPITPFTDAHTDPGAQAGGTGELVLYNIPSSLTVPVERDSVRQAIVESRARARERSNTMVRDAIGTVSGRGNGRGQVDRAAAAQEGTGMNRMVAGMNVVQEVDEEDAMDVDMEL